MNKDDIELSFAKDEVRKDYKLGKILATSAIVSDVPLGPIRPRLRKDTLTRKRYELSEKEYLAQQSADE